MIHLKLLSPTDPSPRYAIYLQNTYVGNITTYPVNPDTVSYGILIRRNWRRKGIGRAALNELFEALRARGIRRVLVCIDHENTASLALHKSAGFSPVGSPSSPVCFLERRI